MKLSIVVIYNDNDAHYLEGLAATLPIGDDIEVNLVYSKPIRWQEMLVYKAQHTKYNTILESKGLKEGINYYEMNWNKDKPIRFNDLRNTAQTTAKGEWILFLDPDERLVSFQFSTLENILHTEFDGAFFNMYAPIRADGSTSGSVSLYRTLRLYRNKGYEWVNPLHESIYKDMINKKANITDTHILIVHEGYLAKAESLNNRSKRNLDILLTYRDDFTDINQYYSFLKKELNGYFKFNETPEIL